jgi:hypothetical protein
MGRNNSFKFLEEKLNRQLIALLRKAKIKHEIGKDGMVHYSPEDEETVENDLIGSIRDGLFRSWQVLTCPPDWSLRYKNYMKQRGIPFHEELSNGETWFLLPRKFRPHQWKLVSSLKPERMAM